MKLYVRWSWRRIDFAWLVEREARSKNQPQIAAAKQQTPFDVLVEGLISEKSRGDKTPLELFLAGIRVWEAGLRRRFDGGNP